MGRSFTTGPAHVCCRKILRQYHQEQYCLLSCYGQLYTSFTKVKFDNQFASFGLCLLAWLKLKGLNVSTNVYSLCQIILKDFSLQGYWYQALSYNSRIYLSLSFLLGIGGGRSRKLQYHFASESIIYSSQLLKVILILIHLTLLGLRLILGMAKQLELKVLFLCCLYQSQPLFNTGACAAPSLAVLPCNDSPAFQTFKSTTMDPSMKQLWQTLVEVETEAENLLFARHQLVENDRPRNGNREALTALRRRAWTTKSSVPSPFETVMREIEGTKELVKEICPTCGDDDSKENTWMMFPGSDIFARMPFRAVHTTLEKDQERLDYDTKKLQSYVKEKSVLISERGAIADRISPCIIRSMVALTDI